MNSRSSAITCCLISVTIAGLVSCNRSSLEQPIELSHTESIEASPELQFEEQLAAVRQDLQRFILVSDEVIHAEQLSQLSELTNLQTLQLDSGVDESESLFALPKLESLKHLRIRSSAIDDDGLKHIVESFPNLLILNLPVTSLTSISNEVLLQLPQLNSLRIGGENIDRGFLEQLRSLPKLQHLHLIGPRLSDDDLLMIAELMSLNSFYLDDCELSDSAWEKFFSLRPRMHVHLDQFHHDRDPSKHPHQ